MHQPIEDTRATQTTYNWLSHTVVRAIAVAAILLPFLALAKSAGVL